VCNDTFATCQTKRCLVCTAVALVYHAMQERSAPSVAERSQHPSSAPGSLPVGIPFADIAGTSIVLETALLIRTRPNIQTSASFMVSTIIASLHGLHHNEYRRLCSRNQNIRAIFDKIDSSFLRLRQGNLSSETTAETGRCE
jgi:hypothetical protein